LGVFGAQIANQGESAGSANVSNFFNLNIEQVYSKSDIVLAS